MSKVKYGLKNVHYAVVTETTNAETGAVTTTYGTVKAWPGAVSITLDPQGDNTVFHADDYSYFVLGNNTGYSGSFVSALVPEDVEISVYGQSKDANGAITEAEGDTISYIALMFEFALDASGRRYVFYRNMLSRHAVASTTKGETIEPQTDTVSFTATPRPDDGKVKAYVDKNATAYSTWYNAVYVAPAAEATDEDETDDVVGQ